MITRGLFGAIVVILLMTSCQNRDDSENLSQSQGGIPGLLKPASPTDESSTTQPPLTPPAGESASSFVLMQHKWCRKIEAQGVVYVERWDLKSSKQVQWTAFRVDPTGERSQVAGEASGNWSVIGNQLTLDFGGQIQTFEIKHSPQGPSGSPQLQMNTGFYDPCA